jgi:hypothetical protein
MTFKLMDSITIEGNEVGVAGAGNRYKKTGLVQIGAVSNTTLSLAPYRSYRWIP